MSENHWLLLALTGALLLILLGISLSSSPGSRAYRWAQRVFWAALLLWISGEMGGIGLNGLNWAVSSLLGLPGYAGLTVISIMR